MQSEPSRSTALQIGSLLRRCLLVAVAAGLAGLPAGVQIIAAKGEDRTAIAVAGMLEKMGCRFEVPPFP